MEEINSEYFNETKTIVTQLNNPQLSNQTQLEKEKEKLKSNFNNILNGISSLEELNVLKKCFSTFLPTLTALKNNVDKQPFKNVSSQVSPQKIK